MTASSAAESSHNATSARYEAVLADMGQPVQSRRLCGHGHVPGRNGAPRMAGWSGRASRLTTPRR
jgi:hypothetical protein